MFASFAFIENPLSLTLYAFRYQRQKWCSK